MLGGWGERRAGGWWLVGAGTPRGGQRAASSEGGIGQTDSRMGGVGVVGGRPIIMNEGGVWRTKARAPREEGGGYCVGGRGKGGMCYDKVFMVGRWTQRAG